MWNPFKKSKEKQLKEAIATAILNNCIDEAKDEISNNLKNKNVDGMKLYQLLASKSQIFITEFNDTRNVLGFLGDYKYNIERINNEEELEFTIDSKLYMLVDTLTELTKYVSIVVGCDYNNNVFCFGEFGSVLVNNSEINISLSIRVPFNEILEISYFQ